MTDSTIVFLHIPKAAGATLRAQLIALYGRERVYWLRPGQTTADLERLREMPERERAAFKVVTGHIRHGMVDDLLPQPLHYITVLRDPVERIRSLFQFVLERPTHPYHDAARQGDLAHFAAVADFSELVNVQARIVSGDIVWRYFDEDGYQRALNNLRRFALVGVQEDYDRFVNALAERFGWSHIPPVQSANVAASRIAVDDAARAVIEKRNVFDRRLHREVTENWLQSSRESG